MTDERWNPPPPERRPAVRATRTPLTELAWYVTKDGRSMACELFNAARFDAGWEVVLKLDGEWQFARWCPDEGLARFAAQALKQDHLHGGWAE